MRLPHSGDTLKLRLSCFLQDGLAHKQVASIKGAAGLVCCPLCTNILNCDPRRLENDTEFHHFATAKPKDFIRQTHDFFYQCCDRLMEAHGTVTKAKFDNMQKSLGISFNADSVVHDKELRSVYSVPEHTYQDPMHMLVSTGGVAQIEIQVFLNHAQAQHNLEWSDVDEFCSSVRCHGRKLPRDFFAKRAGDPTRTQIKAFAAECLLALELLCLFFEVVVLLFLSFCFVFFSLIVLALSPQICKCRLD